MKISFPDAKPAPTRVPKIVNPKKKAFFKFFLVMNFPLNTDLNFQFLFSQLQKTYKLFQKLRAKEKAKNMPPHLIFLRREICFFDEVLLVWKFILEAFFLKKNILKSWLLCLLPFEEERAKELHFFCVKNLNKKSLKQLLLI